MNGFKDITKEIEQPEKLKEGDSPRISEEKALQAAPDIYQDALKSFDLRGDVAEESTEKKENDRTEILEKGEDGRYMINPEDMILLKHGRRSKKPQQRDMTA